MDIERIVNTVTRRRGRRTWESDKTLKVFEEAWYEDPARQQVYSLIALVAQPGITLLDGGCGIGFDAERILARFREIKYTGVDTSNKMVERCKKKLNPNHPGAAFELGDISNLSFPDKHFDIVISCNVLVHIPNFVAALNSLCRVCGKHLIMQFNYINERGEYLAQLSPREFDARFLDKRSMMYFVYYNPQEITDMCSELGFERVFKGNFWLDKYERDAVVMQFNRREIG